MNDVMSTGKVVSMTVKSLRVLALRDSIKAMNITG